MGSTTQGTAPRVRIVGDASADLHDLIAAAGAVVDPAAAIALVDRRTERWPVSAGALVIVSAGDAAALADAFAGDAAGFLVDPVEPAALAAALRFAARNAAVPRRRTDDADATTLWVAAARPATLALAALTRFEIVNAAFGREAGDALLVAAEARIVAAAGEGALVRRHGGAGFLIALPPGASSCAIAQVEAALTRAVRIGEQQVHVGSRVGVVDVVPPIDAARVLRSLEEATAAAKASDPAGARLGQGGPTAPDRLAADLHHAIDRGEIGIVFQPQVALTNGAITGVEALARWEHRVLGPLGAHALFAAADRADLGLALSDHLHTLALQEAARWPAALSALRLSINVTAADLTRPDFTRRFLDRVDASGFPRERLTVELTETGLIEPLEAAAAMLGTLRDAGVRVAIDDFGTGYSSLAYLKTLPLDYLKIDRSLTQDVTGSARDRVIVHGIIAMAHALGLETIAEGVETPEQRDALAAEGCTFFQGFLCAGGIDGAALERLVAG